MGNQNYGNFKLQTTCICCEECKNNLDITLLSTKEFSHSYLGQRCFAMYKCSKNHLFYTKQSLFDYYREINAQNALQNSVEVKLKRKILELEQTISNFVKPPEFSEVSNVITESTNEITK